MINCIFHKCFSESNITEDRYRGNNFNHTIQALRYLQKYECPVDPTYEIPLNYTINICDSYSDVDLHAGKLNIIFVPLLVVVFTFLSKDDITRDVKSSGASTSTCTSFSNSSLKALYLLPAV